MKGIHYLAGVLRVYRTALDAFCNSPETYRPDPAWLQELTTLSHRGYTTGFLFGDPRDVGQSYQAGYQRSHLLVGSLEAVKENSDGVVLVRNRFRCGDQLELIGPQMKQGTLHAENLRLLDADDCSTPLDVVQPNMRILMPVPPGTAAGDLLRLPVTSS